MFTQVGRVVASQLAETNGKCRRRCRRNKVFLMHFGMFESVCILEREFWSLSLSLIYIGRSLEHR